MSIILPLLLTLVAQDADKLAAPVAAEGAAILYAPSRSLRSATAAAETGLPATPVTLRFQCLVDDGAGIPQSCLLLDGAAQPAARRTEYDRRLAAQTLTPAARVALARIRFTRTRPSGSHAPAGATPVLVPMIFTETVSTGDVLVPGAPAGVIASGDMEMLERPTAELLTSYYPTLALKDNVEVRMKALCRIGPDRKLFCRDAEPTAPDSKLTPELTLQFELATYQVLDGIRLEPLSKKGDPVVGRDVEVRIAFVLPE
ncbi:hypothetical protein P1X14_13855 [Sphingomonas sp. AOB5]|uniref:hypothetical protein n=1 Tax=Sphingomonas sp. AOB5 TaxID=3034017 RepID=UPI0023F774BD|nr:hypothetical protein [Sphingomonas sp. AOB5]MDF7776335.1 hypothetical protein [Sphingomonas sp. AOB5]